MSGLNTPVAFFIFNRPDLTARTFAVIREARPKRLLVVADGPRNDAEAQRCEDARAGISVDWDCDLSTNYSATNLGCGKRVSSGLDWVFEQSEEAIILEDDCVPSATFFHFCEELLERYRFDERVMLISGSNEMPSANAGDAYSFSKYGGIWGWASWRRAWQHYDFRMESWPTSRNRLRSVFPNWAERWYWKQIFEATYRKRIDTWDYQWFFARLLKGGLAAVPPVNLVANVGFRSDATHTVYLPEGAEAWSHSHDLADLKHPVGVVADRIRDAEHFDRVVNPSGLRGLVALGLYRLMTEATAADHRSAAVVAALTSIVRAARGLVRTSR